MTGISRSEPRRVRPAPLGLFVLACLIAGTLARFWGLGHWPLAIDEYYLERSVQNVLHFGIPQFPCGGLYLRGVLLQYACALLQWMGLSAELAPRLIAAVSSLLLLPAAYQIGRRLQGRELGLLLVAFLALSVWEIEIGRFGRMYAPFQTVFAWYLVFFLRYSLDREQRALGPMLVLSIIGMAVWEGGIFLILTNFLSPFLARPDGRLPARDWLYLSATSLLMIPGYFLDLTDLRTASAEPALPADYVEPPDAASLSRLDAAVMPWTTLTLHIPWLVAAIIPAALVVYAAARELRSEGRTRPLGAGVTVIILACAALQQFELGAGLFIIGVLLGILDRNRWAGTGARPLQLAVLACAVFWLLFGLSTDSWHTAGLAPIKKALLLTYEFGAFPDTLRQVAMPWARTVPLLTFGLLILLAATYIRACRRLEQTGPAERILLALLLMLMLAASAANPTRHETRYVFFLYPLALAFAILSIMRLCLWLLPQPRKALAAAVLLSIAAFAASEDFRPGHLWNIDTEAINFRIGMDSRLAGHYHPRSDVRAAADWLRQHARPGEDLVINSFPGVDFYFPQANFYFVSETDSRFEAWSCKRGTVQRWSNLPMLRSYDALALQAAQGRRMWLVLETSNLPHILSRIPAADWTIAWTSQARDITIVAVHAVGKQQSTS